MEFDNNVNWYVMSNNIKIATNQQDLQKRQENKT